MGDRKAPTPFPENQLRPSPPPAPPPRRDVVTNEDYERWKRGGSAVRNGDAVDALRNQFALAVLPAVYAAHASGAGSGSQEAIAQECYEIADAMLEAKLK